MTTCHFTKNDTPKFIFCWKTGTPKNGTPRTFIYGSYPPPPRAFDSPRAFFQKLIDKERAILKANFQSAEFSERAEF